MRMVTGAYEAASTTCFTISFIINGLPATMRRILGLAVPFSFWRTEPWSKPRKLHKPVRLSHPIHYFFHFSFVLRRCKALVECSHVRMTDLCVDSGNHHVKGFGGNDVDSLDVNFLNAHVRCVSFCCCRRLARQDSERQIDDLDPLVAVDDAFTPGWIEIGERLFRDGFQCGFSLRL